MQKELVNFDQVCLSYDSQISDSQQPAKDTLQDICFSVEEGDYFFLTGASGAGKTSLLKLLYFGQKPTSGNINILSHDVTKMKRRDIIKLRRKIGIVFQDFRLLPHLSAFDNVALPLRASGIHEDDIRKNVSEILKWVGLGARINALPETLSGGEQQRVALARAIINRPKILLADEPTGNVDDEIAHRLMYLLEELNRLGTTIIVATHDEGIIKRFPHPQLHLQDGHLKCIPAERRTDFEESAA